MADGKKRNSMTTLGMSMLSFGRKLMRSYEPSSKHVETPVPYQSMSTSSLDWDTVVPASAKQEAPLPEEPEMPYEEVDSFDPSPFQSYQAAPPPQARPQRPVQRRPQPRPQPPQQAPVQRKAQPQKPSRIDPRLQRVLDFHKQREAERQATRAERRRQWEETEGDTQSPAPDIPGWQPKKRASFDYIETSSLTKGADVPSQSSETKSDPIQRKTDEEPERPVRSQIFEQNEESDFDEGFIGSNEPPFDDHDINLGTDDMDTVLMDSIAPSSDAPIQRQVDIPSVQSEENDTHQEQFDSFSQATDNKQSNKAPRPSQPTVEQPQNRRVQRRAENQAQTPEQSHDTQDADSGEYEADDDGSDSFRVSPTANKSSPIQRTPEQNQDIANTRADIPEAQSDDSDSMDGSYDFSPAPDISSSQAAQPPVQRFADDNDWDDDFQDDDFQDDNYDFSPAPDISSSQPTQQPVQRFADDNDWDDDFQDDDFQDDNYDFSPAPDISNSQAAQQPVQRFADDNDWDDDFQDDDFQDDNYDFSPAPDISNSQAAQQPVQRFADDNDWDDDFQDDDFQDDNYDFSPAADISSSQAAQQPVQRFANDNNWDDDFQDGDFQDDNYDFSPAPDISNSQQTQPPVQKPAIQRRADKSSSKQSHDTHDSQADMSGEANDFPVVQRSIGADGKLYYNVVEDDEQTEPNEQDIDVYQAMLDAGLVEPNMPQASSTDYGHSSEAHSDIQRQADIPHNDGQNNYPTVQRQVGADGQMYYNASEDDMDSLPEQNMDVYQAMVEAGMIPPPHGQSPETSPTSDPVQRTADSPLSSIGVPQDIQDAMVQRMREKNKQARENKTPNTSTRTNSSQQQETNQGPIQRTYAANVQRKPPVADTIMREEESIVADDGDEANLDKLARDVYKMLRKRLRDEAERRNRKL